MSYPWQFKDVNEAAKHIMQRQDKNKKLLENSKEYIVSTNDNKINYEEKRRKEREEEKEIIIKKLTDYNNEANSLMELINQYLESKDFILKEQIKMNFKTLKDKMKLEYNKHNKAKYYGGLVERAFYVPAIKDAWVNISSFQYTRTPSKEMYSAVNDVTSYTNYYLIQLRNCNVMELGK